MARFRKKPVVIEAIQWTGANVSEVTNWLAEHAPDVISNTGPCRVQFELGRDKRGAVAIRTLENAANEHVRASAGDWIIRGVKGEIYPCKPDIFEATYEAAE